MSRPRVAVIGSGVCGTAVAQSLVARGVDVDVYEKGDALADLPADLRDVVQHGDFKPALRSELVLRVGGMATRWRAIAVRWRPPDFATRAMHGYGTDWPLSYDDLEPWYGRAERLLGVAGTDADNPFAPRRSTPHPLPAFPLTPDDRLLAGRLAAAGVVLSTTPQAIARTPYDGRPGCANVGPTCNTCPTGARYSPVPQLARAQASGRCRLHARTAVRRILLDPRGRARALVCRGLDDREDREVPADIVVCAAGAVESARLLLLSRDARWPDGLGNAAGHVGRHLTLRHLWKGRLHYREDLHPGRSGPMTGQSHQFLDPLPGGRRGGIKVEFTSHLDGGTGRAGAATAAEIVAQLRAAVRVRQIGLHAETVPGPAKQLSLSRRRDRFGDPFARVRYRKSEFDVATHAHGRALVERFAAATGAVDAEYAGIDDVASVSHHLGTCRMGATAADGVVDPTGRVHGTANVFAVGGAVFVGPSPLNPTLTMVALALRTADRIAATCEVAP